MRRLLIARLGNPEFTTENTEDTEGRRGKDDRLFSVRSAPAFLKNGHGVIGILRSSALHYQTSPRRIQFKEPDSKQSESLLPISEVVSRLDRVAPDWGSRKGVCARPDTPNPLHRESGWESLCRAD